MFVEKKAIVYISDSPSPFPVIFYPVISLNQRKLKSEGWRALKCQISAMFSEIKLPLKESTNHGNSSTPNTRHKKICGVSLPSLHERQIYRKPNFFSSAACWITFVCKVQCKQVLSHWTLLPVSLQYIDNTDRQELTPASCVMTETQGKACQNGTILYAFFSQFAKASTLWRLKAYTLAYILVLLFIVFILLFPHLLMYMVAEAWTESSFICRSPHIAI